MMACVGAALDELRIMTCGMLCATLAAVMCNAWKSELNTEGCAVYGMEYHAEDKGIVHGALCTVWCYAQRKVAM